MSDVRSGNRSSVPVDDVGDVCDRRPVLEEIIERLSMSEAFVIWRSVVKHLHHVCVLLADGQCRLAVSETLQRLSVLDVGSLQFFFFVEPDRRYFIDAPNDQKARHSRPDHEAEGRDCLHLELVGAAVNEQTLGTVWRIGKYSD